MDQFQKMKIISIFHFLFLIFSTFFFIAQPSRIHNLTSSQNRLAFFIFGDSFVDPGNNNFINTTEPFRANFTPYGQTFFKYPTGRVSDGRIMPDFIAEYANLPLIPAYLDPHNKLYIHGANFASGGAGVLVETHRGLAIGIETQLRYFKKVERSIRKKLGDSRAYDLFSNSVYFFHIGGNDYKVPFEGSSVHEKYSETEHAYMVIGNLTAVLEEIYKKGGRKFAFVGIPPLGCLPHTRLLNKNGDGSCWDEASALATLHNKLFPIALQKFADKFPGFKYTVADMYTMLQNRIDNPSKYGFKEGKKACCGSGKFRGIFSCGRMRGEEEFELCENPNEYLFFDSYHPNERAYEQFAKLMWSGDSQVINPYNLKQFFQYGSLQA
ncbi:GDSL esterase/lipase 5-like [Cucumis melo var. makuwa]|uniref:GDSL esterase/lipase 5-like n=2 Tax=Cucumis melo TaxID=3656 RepID=A0A1S3CH21_CUCME|nr:GDSL lipase-like isoform X1 [Cucumis melo]KAA0059366.1 GDSL esterase/lipase 5-like [Cucumis melo var. makuwa]TYK03960.1 GDSL esterase/lipase 5-like [Cucumis melo var. makuwa]